MHPIKKLVVTSLTVIGTAVLAVILFGIFTAPTPIIAYSQSTPEPYNPSLALRSSHSLRDMGWAVAAQEQISTCQTFSNPTVLNIPDWDGVAGVISSTIKVGMTGYIADVTVHTSLTHSYPEDIELDFCEPGRSCILEDERLSSTACTACGLSFNDNAALYVSEAAPPYGGTYIPDTSGPWAYPVYAPLNTYVPAIGSYTLVAKDWAGGDTGTLNGWSMTLCTVPLRPTRTPSPPTETPEATSPPAPTYTPAFMTTCDGTPLPNPYHYEWSDVASGEDADILGNLCIKKPPDYYIDITFYAYAEGGGMAVVPFPDSSMGGDCPSETTSETFGPYNPDAYYCYKKTALKDCHNIYAQGFNWNFSVSGESSTTWPLCPDPPGMYSSGNMIVDVGITPWPTATPVPTNTPTPMDTPTITPTPCATVKRGGGAWFIW